MIDLAPQHLQTVKRILAEHVPDCEVRAFGSRVTWTAKDYSDLDLAVVGTQALDTDVLRRLGEAFQESDLPFRVDILDWHTIAESFRMVIQRQYEVLQHKAVPDPMPSAGQTGKTSAVESEWPIVRIGDLADSISDTHKCRKDQLIFLNTSDILLGKMLHQTYSAVKNWPGQAKKSIRRGDILFSEIRPANGRYAFVDIDADDYVVSTKLMVIRARNNCVMPRFLYHFLTSKKVTGWLQHLAESRSGTFPQITFDQVAELELPLPPESDQVAIAAFLDTIDGKIELNRQMSETLEAMARTIFKSWFVDFDPVLAKAAGEEPIGLAPHIADLFPDSFEDSELGKIPKGWKVYALTELMQINPTRSLSKGSLSPYLDMSNMPTQGPSPASWMMREAGSGMKFTNGDTLVARITPCLENGKTAFVDFLADGEVGWGSTEYIVIRPNGAIPPVFAYLLARTEEFRAFAIQQMTGSSGRQRVPADSFRKYPIAVPDVDSSLFQCFGKLVLPLFEWISAGMSQSRTLASIRDTLLPKLISGEIRIEDAEQFVERTI